MTRVDDTGAAYAGSQLQTQIYVNRWPDKLDHAIRGAFSDLDEAQIEWRSPIREDDYREYYDGRFLQLLGLDDHVPALADFWPRGGPHWDGLALVRRPGHEQAGVILVEGKSYPGELRSGGSGATAEKSTDLIAKSLAWTQGQIGVTGKTSADRIGPLYQDANRLAHLYWLNSIGVDAWLVHLLFTGDDHNQATTEAQWRDELVKANAELGIAGLEIPRAGHVFLPAGTREDLVT